MNSVQTIFKTVATIKSGRLFTSHVVQFRPITFAAEVPDRTTAVVNIAKYHMCEWPCSQPTEVLDLLDGLLTLDCEKRLKPSEAVKIPWLRNAVMSFQPTGWYVACFIASLFGCIPLGYLAANRRPMECVWVARASLAGGRKVPVCRGCVLYDNVYQRLP